MALAQFWPELGRIHPNKSQLGTGTVLEAAKASAHPQQAVWMQASVLDDS